MRRIAVTIAVLTLVALPAAAETFTIDKAHSEVSFQIRHLVTKVRGNFTDFAGTISGDAANPAASTVEFKIRTASINTANTDRDQHLRSADFFDAEKFPEITFKSHRIDKTGENNYQVTGLFTLRGVSKEMTLPVTYLGEVKDPWGNTKTGFETVATLDRRDFGVNWNAPLDAGGFVLGDEVTIAINLEAQEQK